MHTSKKSRRCLSPAPSFRPVPPPTQPGDTRSPVSATPNPPTLGGPQRSGEVGSGEVGKSGPRTPEGRAVSARNATTHGLFSRQTVLPHLGEDADGYKKVLDALTEQFDPRTLMERQYLELWAEASWKLRRLSRWEAQLWEQADLDEDARLGKLERVMRLQTTLRRQLDKAVRMLAQDVPDVQKHYARRAVLASRSLTETDCRHDSRIAYDVEAAAQAEILAAPGLLALDRTHLDASDTPPADRAVMPQRDTAPGLIVCDYTETEPAAWEDTEICQNEPLPPVAIPTEAPAATPNPPIVAIAFAAGERGPQRSGEVGPRPDPASKTHTEQGLPDPNNEICQNKPHPCEAPAASCHWPLSLSEGGGVPDEGGVGAVP